MDQTTNEIVDVVRPLANFHPDIWSDFFYEFTPIDEAAQNEVEELMIKLREEVRKELLTFAKEDKKEAIVLIDIIQKLRVATHFEQEIKGILEELFHKDDSLINDDLRYASLLFRLLRQQGLLASSDVFDKFKDENGSFKENLKSNLEGMINLFEASHMRVHDEKVLEEALVFTKNHLTMLTSIIATSPKAVQQVTHALTRPLAKCTAGLEAVYQLSVYKSNASYYESLLKLAKLDFNRLQQLHKMEIRDLVRWSRSLDLSTKFPFARDRIVEAYIWTLGVYYEAKFSCARIKLNKAFKIISIIDDIYDAYGTIEELELFTKAILRWDRNCMNELPNYMKLAMELVYDTFQEFEQHFAEEKRPYAVECLQNELIRTCESYMVEARWCDKKYIPSYDEYMKNAKVSSDYRFMLIAAHQGTDVNVTRDVIEWMHQNPKAIEASCIIARLLDDMGGYWFDKKRNHVASAMECYMESFGVSEDKAFEELYEKVEEAWMDVSGAMFGQTVVPQARLTLVNMCKGLNDLFQIGEDGYTVSKYIKSKIQALLVQPAIYNII